MKEAIKKNVPDKIDLNKITGKNEQDLQNIKDKYLLIKKGMWVLYALILVVLGICFLFTYYLKNTSKWVGICLIASGVITILLGILNILFIKRFKVPENMKDLDHGINQLLSIVNHEFLVHLFVTAAIIIVISLATLFFRQIRQSIGKSSSV